MAKYRLLTLQELQALEQEFINYLVLNGITAEDWEKLKKEDVSKAEHVLELFSDVVFESIMRKVEYLEFRAQKEIKTYQCLASKIVLVGMTADPKSEADFTNPAFIQQAVQNPPGSLKVYTSEKAYAKVREEELFEMTLAGCVISDGKLFKALCLALPGSH